MIRFIASVLFVGFIISCNKEVVVPVVEKWEPTTNEGLFTYNTYKTVALQKDGKVQKWDKEKVYYWFDNSGVFLDYMVSATDSIFLQINELTQSSKFEKTTDEAKADIKIFHGYYLDFEDKYKLKIGNELRLGGTAFSYIDNNVYQKVVIWVNNHQLENERKLVLRHEIGHALGFLHVPTQKSIMWDTVDETYNNREYTKLDKEYIMIHYDKRTKAGMTQLELSPVFKDYLK